jgi:hypothetical protein
MKKIPIYIEYWGNPLVVTLNGNHKDMQSIRMVKCTRDVQSGEIDFNYKLTTEFQKRIIGKIFDIDEKYPIKKIHTVTFSENEIAIKMFGTSAMRMEEHIRKALKDEFEFVAEARLAFAD